ncbi:hypothetical protein [Bradyrhizobium sp. AUGA SZCCT0042]|uniref:hypothetical protein n=1 Tax=Bradyrhizobium sp. AUGA SZCCT0042 TaxID=2807651 RepID=UPI001BA73777|nr:hypothetical protein [Bradyrhizobium sp. AUGA SZCCT0042]MBR1298544.1 hypothetical protein [Bradyrhizobium sp. AUGA SZCCT0042]
MAIPTAFDHALGDVENAAGAVMVQLRVLQHSAPGDVPRLRAALRDLLQAYVDQVMTLARDDDR